MLTSHKRVMAIIGCVTLCLNACTEDSDSAVTIHQQQASADVELPVPQVLLQSRIIDRSNLEPEVTVNGQVQDATQIGDQHFVSVFVQPGVPIELSIRWSEEFAGMMLPLAALEDTLDPINVNSERTISASNYSVEPFDADSDGSHNLEERNNGTDPFDSSEP